MFANLGISIIVVFLHYTILNIPQTLTLIILDIQIYFHIIFSISLILVLIILRLKLPAKKIIQSKILDDSNSEQNLESNHKRLAIKDDLRSI